ncbi:hypothetical protein ACEPAG_2179 [Sanghuangporus baumii]
MLAGETCCSLSADPHVVARTEVSMISVVDATTQSPMDPEIQQALKIALGSAFIGFGIATTLYGITCLQIYLYYRNHAKDPFGVKLMAGHSFSTGYTC